MKLEFDTIDELKDFLSFFIHEFQNITPQSERVFVKSMQPTIPQNITPQNTSSGKPRGRPRKVDNVTLTEEFTDNVTHNELPNPLMSPSTAATIEPTVNDIQTLEAAMRAQENPGGTSESENTTQDDIVLKAQIAAAANNMPNFSNEEWLETVKNFMQTHGSAVYERIKVLAAMRIGGPLDEGSKKRLIAACQWYSSQTAISF